MAEKPGHSPRRVARIFSQVLRHLETRTGMGEAFSPERIIDIYEYLDRKSIDSDLVEAMLPVVIAHPKMELSSVLSTIGFTPRSPESVIDQLPVLEAKFREINHSPDPMARHRWIMGRLRPMALGNIDLAELSERVGGGHNG